MCKVCWWEDDGQDDDKVDVAMGGPNYHLSLTQARYNFVKNDISDPTRHDLMKLKHPKEMYLSSKLFMFSEGCIIEEKENWKGIVE
ncbi:MAG: CPCC family cysteine-rich protein [Gammaproteobacteria bacterium]